MKLIMQILILAEEKCKFNLRNLLLKENLFHFLKW